MFLKYNKKTNAAFKVVREKLAEMSGGTVRCNYCEDSNANNYKARLFEYVTKKEVGTTEAELNPLIDSLKSEHHQTVWYEMIRQRRLHPILDDLFNRAPEALNWLQ